MARQTLAIVAACCCLASCRAPLRAGSSPGSPAEVHRLLLSQRDLPELPGWESRLYLIEFPPGVAAPLHVHPTQCVGYVLEGSFESGFGDEPLTVKHEGESFVDLAEQPHRFRNPDPARPLRFLVAGSFPKGAPLFKPLSR